MTFLNSTLFYDQELKREEQKENVPKHWDSQVFPFPQSSRNSATKKNKQMF